MQEHWEEVRAFLKREWIHLTEVDLDEIDGEYDRLIRKIKEIYKGADEITQEAAIKSKLQRFLNLRE
ncbi:MAG: hypothetical protein HYW02_00205 [Deltaproteobacteria bacterium]|nr:hypothetical protein [Deltaproteobacteria bacterium]MBI2499910.1 hypothetical protein [Deltaproteobacteria bacterium]MBI4197264.1 hypothetical protein [Deltaproteobacteria bacterium]